ncbi:leucine-rich repeat-containing protein 71 [Periophthalmus magnuspinnatus]|uniref:leucine-rich repeat-containing protein 71 n=1 Tax=Periophthalmus magnuspinnatus TaxID=409849 RepID=UPI002436ED7D|nr:leucine-rich repeat-containing protein 71 [Periophthalmus magnuspinnatus]
MMKKKGKENKAHAAEEDVSKQTGQLPPEPVTCLTFDDYQCTGNVQEDFPKLCALLDIKNIPPVHCKSTETEEEELPEENETRITQWWKLYLCVDLEDKTTLSCKGLRITGWKIDEHIWKVLTKMLQHLSRLQSVYLFCSFWKAGLTDEMITSLSNTLSVGSSLRVVYLDGNPLPNHSYHLLLSEDSLINRLFLRNNQIGDEGARLIGSALSTTKTANKNLLFLNLAFNCIGNAGAAYLAQGLRLNRALIYLSLANNQIGDSGAARISKILGEFPLTHEEVVERRKLLIEKQGLNFWSDVDGEGPTLSEANTPVKPDPKGNAKKKEVAKKEEKPEKAPASKETLKKGAQKPPKTPDKAPPAKGGKAAGKKKPAPVEEKSTNALVEPEVEIVNPLLDPLAHRKDGHVFLPGNSTLVYLSLAGNAITEESLPLFLTSLEQQTEGGLLRLCLNRNNFSPDCELFNKINHLLQLRDPKNRPATEPGQDEGHK